VTRRFASVAQRKRGVDDTAFDPVSRPGFRDLVFEPWLSTWVRYAVRAIGWARFARLTFPWAHTYIGPLLSRISEETVLNGAISRDSCVMPPKGDDIGD